jgi:hypothetical protein
MLLSEVVTGALGLRPNSRGPVTPNNMPNKEKSSGKKHRMEIYVAWAGPLQKRQSQHSDSLPCKD